MSWQAYAGIAALVAAFSAGWMTHGWKSDSDALLIEKAANAAQLATAEEIKQSFYNAYKAIKYEFPQALYVEGWIKDSDGLVIEHAWLEQDGQIVDPTILDDVPYFPAIRLTLDRLQEGLKKNNLQLPLASKMVAPIQYLDLYHRALEFFDIHIIEPE